MRRSNGAHSKRRRPRHRLSVMLKRFFNISLCLLLFSAVITPIASARDKVAEGATDIAKGMASVPQTAAETANNSNILSGIIVGTAKGLMTAVEGVCEGMYKILTFHRPD